MKGGNRHTNKKIDINKIFDENEGKLKEINIHAKNSKTTRQLGRKKG